MRKCLLVSILLAAAWACNTREVVPDAARMGYNYFPLAVGQYAVYQVQHIRYATGRPADTTRYQVKEVVADTFTDLTGEEAFRIQRYYRFSEQTTWKTNPDSVWTAKRSPSRAVRTENNVPFVKLIFPVKEAATWNGNTFNARGEEKYRISSIGAPYQLSQHTYDHTLQVIQGDTDNDCKKDTKVEVYAENVGLIYRESDVLEYTQSDNTCDGRRIISFGASSTQRLIESGQ